MKLINEARRMQQLAGLIKEDIQQEKYYAVIDIHGNPRTLETNSKEEMVISLNQELGSNEYSLEDMNDDVKNQEGYDHYISDDWAMVTNDIDVFNTDKNLVNI